MKKSVIVLGDPLSSGGSVVSTVQTFINAIGIPVATIGDSTFCPIPFHWSGQIVEGYIPSTINGQPIAYDGCKVSCGCTLVAKHALNKVFVGDATPEEISTESKNEGPKNSETGSAENKNLIDDSNIENSNSNESFIFSKHIAEKIEEFNKQNKKDKEESKMEEEESDDIYYYEVVYADTGLPVENMSYKMDGMEVQKMENGKTVKTSKEPKKFRFWMN